MKQDPAFIEQELQWLAQLINTRFTTYFNQDSGNKSILEVASPELPSKQSQYGTLIKELKLTPQERIILAMALSVYIKPQLLDIFFMKNTHIDRGFTEFGGVRGQNHSGFIPTAQTALFVIAGGNLETIVETLPLFKKSKLFVHRIMKLSATPQGEPYTSGMLMIASDYLKKLGVG